VPLSGAAGVRTTTGHDGPFRAMVGTRTPWKGAGVDPDRTDLPAGHGVSDTVADAALRTPKVLPAGATVGEARVVLTDEHVHAVLLLDDGFLLTVVERGDIEGVPDPTPALGLGQLDGRTVAPDADLATTWAGMTAAGTRRLAVVDARGALLGLLCLKRHGRGFCSAADVAARERERAEAGSANPVTAADRAT
jgi:CBS domain-containing protein